MLLKEQANKRARNRAILRKIVETIVYVGSTVHPFRGHREGHFEVNGDDENGDVARRFRMLTDKELQYLLWSAKKNGDSKRYP